jgi:hypothetical protein
MPGITDIMHPPPKGSGPLPDQLFYPKFDINVILTML